jgi:four helix bundle protein
VQSGKAPSDTVVTHEPRSQKASSFTLADSLVEAVYKVSESFSVAERFGLQAQLRRAAVSTACNIVEGCARRTTKEYLNFLNVAAGSSAEAWYLVDLSRRLRFLNADADSIEQRYKRLCGHLHSLIESRSTQSEVEKQ